MEEENKGLEKISFVAFIVSGTMWLSMFLFAFLDSFFTPMSWSAQWMDTVFVFLVNASMGVGVLAAIAGWIIFIKAKVGK
jgi:hypothetical protein